MRDITPVAPPGAASARRWRERLRLARAHFLRAGFPWHLADPAASPEGRRLRKAARRAMHAIWPGWARPVVLPATALAWPVVSSAAAWRAARQPEMTRRARLAQAVRLAWRALRHNVPPAEAAALVRGDGRFGAADDWLFEAEYVALARRFTSPGLRALMTDKLALKARLRDAGLAVPETLAHVAGGEIDPAPLDAALARGDGLVVKPRHGSRGVGVEGFTATPDGFLSDLGGPPRAGAALAAALSRRARREGALLVERRLRPHPAFGALARRAVPVLRILTADGPAGGEVALLSAICELRPEDALGRGAVACLPVERPAGRLSLREDPPAARGSGLAALDGAELPDWTAAVALAEAAHRALPCPVPVVGWDVALADTGPVLIEGNLMVSLLVAQLLDREPVAHTPLAPRLLAWISRAEAGELPGAPSTAAASSGTVGRMDAGSTQEGRMARPERGDPVPGPTRADA